MILDQLRYSDNGESTLSIFRINGKLGCYMLEDTQRDIKIKGRTRIWGGIYRVLLRTEGPTHEKYLKRYPKMHKGMLWIQNVREFTYIYFHSGVKAEDTAGCPLTGLLPNVNTIEAGHLIDSRKAYENMYPPISNAILSDEAVYLNIRNI